MKRSASAVWLGSLKEGKGTLTTDTRTLNVVPYTFASRFENGTATNPEELLAAAHAGCFAMALSMILGGAGYTPERLEAKATLSLEQVSGEWTINKSHLDLIATVADIEVPKFEELVNKAKAGCPVSRLFKAEITVSARLTT